LPAPVAPSEVRHDVKVQIRFEMLGEGDGLKALARVNPFYSPLAQHHAIDIPAENAEQIIGRVQGAVCAVMLSVRAWVERGSDSHLMTSSRMSREIEPRAFGNCLSVTALAFGTDVAAG